MKWLKTFSLVIRSNLTALGEYFENPERVLNQLIIDMEEELERIRGNVAAVIADDILLGRQLRTAQDDAAQWQERAASALRRGDEDSAQAALEQKLLAEERAQTMEKEYARHQQDTARLHEAIRNLEHKIRQARHKRTLLIARLARAESSRSIQRVLKRSGECSALAQFERLEHRVERAEALEEAHARLEGDDPQARRLEHQIAQREQRERLQKELSELKRRVEFHD